MGEGGATSSSSASSACLYIHMWGRGARKGKKFWGLGDGKLVVRLLLAENHLPFKNGNQCLNGKNCYETLKREHDKCGHWDNGEFRRRKGDKERQR